MDNSQNESTEEIHKITSVLLSKVLPPSFQKNQKVINVMNAVSQYLLNPVILDCFFFHQLTQHIQDFEKKYTDNITEHPKQNQQKTKEALIKTLCEFPPFMIYFKQPLSSWYSADGSLEWCIQLNEDLATFLETEKTQEHSRVVEATYIVSRYLSRSRPTLTALLHELCHFQVQAFGWKMKAPNNAKGDFFEHRVFGGTLHPNLNGMSLTIDSLWLSVKDDCYQAPNEWIDMFVLHPEQFKNEKDFRFHLSSPGVKKRHISMLVLVHKTWESRHRSIFEDSEEVSATNISQNSSHQDTKEYFQGVSSSQVEAWLEVTAPFRQDKTKQTNPSKQFP